MITTRSELGEYCLRQLGAPVIQINVAPEQITDRLSDAIQKFHEFHGTGSERKFVYFEVSEEDLENQYLQADESTLSVVRVLPLNSMTSPGTHNLQVQATVGSILDIIRNPVGGLSSYVINMQYISLLTDFFNAAKPIRYNQYTNRIYIDTNWENKIQVGDIIVAEVYTLLDPDEYIDVYNDAWLKAYSTALIKKQWGQNMLKYQGFQLPSGVVLDGRSIYDDALREIEILNEELNNTYSLPIDFFVG